MPALLNQDVVGSRERLQAGAELVEEFVGRTRVPCSLPGHRLDHCEEIFRTMGEFAHEEAQVRLALLALGDVHGGAGKADDRAGQVGQGFEMDVVPVRGAVGLDADLAVPGFGGVEDLALEGGEAAVILDAEILFLGAPDDLVGIAAEHRPAH